MDRTSTTPRRRRRSERRRPRILGELLVDRGAVTADELRGALDEQRRSGRRLGEVLVGRGVVDEATVAQALSAQLGLPFVQAPLRVHEEALSLVGAERARERAVIPLSLSARSLRLAMADPLDLQAVDDIRFQTGRRVEPAVATPSAVRDALASVGRHDLGKLLAALPAQLSRVRDDDREALEEAAGSAPVVRLVEHFLERAAGDGASDVHVEPTATAVRVRFRIDGILRSVAELPSTARAPLLSRLKIMAGLDISVKRRPQDGALAFRHGDIDVPVRLSTLPGADGEKAVLRLLDPRRVHRSVDGLGLSPEDLDRLRRLLTAGQGVILAAGPTGSGKSSTLFGALGEVDREGRNVVTLEDPVEYRLDGVNHVQVDPRSGLTFPVGLRSVLRQDPDVVMVGEIRDRETAEIAMAAALTGHLVLSTVHTTDAPGALTRLINMGVPSHLVAGGLTGVVAQRLVRRLCPACLGRNPECDGCPDGYRGRTGVFEVLVMTDAMREAVNRGASTGALRRLAREAGMRSLAEDARRKVAEGTTTPHEVGRVIQADPGAAAPCDECGVDVPIGAVGCPRCGARRISVCPCGREVKRGWRFCAWCLRRVSA